MNTPTGGGVNSRAEVIALIREYARSNMAECTAGVIGDPVLRGRRDAEAVALSERMQMHSAIHSAKYHAAKDILELMGEEAGDL